MAQKYKPNERRNEMTNAEAKHIVDVAFGVPQAVRRVGENRTYHEKEIREAKEMAIKALEKDIPKKVKIEKWIYTTCPSGCGQILSTHHGDGYYTIDHEPDRCPCCGQLLDWD